MLKMNINPEDLIIEISGEGCVKPAECLCCKQFGHHRAKITHKPTDVSAECVQIIHELCSHDKNSEEVFLFMECPMECPKVLALKALELKLNIRDLHE